MSKQQSCAERVNSHWASRKEDLETLLKAEDNYTEDLGYLNEYGLCVDFCEAGTFEGQREDYIRYQFSWGGPSDELRFYRNGDIEYWFLDWFDGASIDVTTDDVAIMVHDWLNWTGDIRLWFDEMEKGNA